LDNLSGCWTAFNGSFVAKEHGTSVAKEISVKGGNMNIKYFPPMGTRSNEKISESQQDKASVENPKTGEMIASKDVFEQAIRGTVDQLLSKAKSQESQIKVEPEKLKPAADCEPMTRGFAQKKLELAANCITFRAEVAGSCIPMKKLEPVADCDPATHNSRTKRPEK
jgi:hypothetical protein